MAPLVIYIAGFRQHAGKTVTSLGLLSLLRNILPPSQLGYIKPVGQELIRLPDGTKIDKDALIVKEFSHIPDLDMTMVSPVRLGSGFTKDYLDSDRQKEMTAQLTTEIHKAFASMAHKKVIIAEGTGHPGVGGIVGLSNAQVANLVDAKAIFLSGGGIGKALDQIEVDLTYFIHHKSTVKGLIFNKLLPDKIDQVKHYINEDLLNQRYGRYFEERMEVFGYLPELTDLNKPSMEILQTTFEDCEPLGAPPGTYEWEKPLNDIRIISLLDEYLKLENLLNKDDLILLGAGSTKRLTRILQYNRSLPDEEKLGGLVLTCGETTSLSEENRDLLENCSLPVLYVREDTAKAERKIERAYSNTKLQPYDGHKIAEIEELFSQYFDLEKFAKAFKL